SEELRARQRAAKHFEDGALAQVVSEWRAHPFPTVNSGELTMIAESLADAGSNAAEAYAEQLRPLRPVDADNILARLRFRQSRLPECAALLTRAFKNARATAWETVDTMQRALDVAAQVAKTHAYAAPLLDAVDRPFASGQWNDLRSEDRVWIANELQSCGPRTVAALHAMEPWPPWNAEMLKLRRDCYQSVLDPAAHRAQREYEEFIDAEPVPLVTSAPRSPP